ncbi:MAG: electron transfer flavoprotein subunit alpha/FixB family protein, partial [Pseudomonadota bacterium]|nr:electron transfer flavoprotein subunit alpha/FixB family protein [Pseudomonadota bacterium]
MNTLLIAEHNNETLADATVKSASAAAQMGGELHVLVAGTNCGAVGEAAAKLDGVSKVLVADDALYEKQLAEPMAALVTSMADGY